MIFRVGAKDLKAGPGIPRCAGVMREYYSKDESGFCYDVVRSVGL